MFSAKRIAIALAAMLVAAGLVLGLVSGAFGALARTGLQAAGLERSPGASTPPAVGATRGSSPPVTASTGPRASSTPSASSAPEPIGLPAPVLAAVTSSKTPSKTKVAAKIGSVQVKDVSSSSHTGSVIDVTSGQTLYAHNSHRAYIPASTMKLLTTTAALAILGPEHTFRTKVVSPSSGRIILVGGGDPYLAEKTTASTYPKRASVAALAQASAAALQKNQVTAVSLGYDDSLFPGPRWNPAWPDLYRDQVTPVSALWVDEGRVNSSPGPRVKNPSLTAAKAFAKALSQQGIRVTSVSAQRAKASAVPVASVSSMPLEQIVEQLLMVSDNDAAEVISRQAALGVGKRGSSADGVAAIRTQLTKLGVWDASTKINDGSGLSRKTRVPADTMARVLRLAASSSHPELRAVITGLPVAGVEGSLRTHYVDDQSRAGRGLVRGKTGTLNKVHSLAGLIRTRDGSVLVYAFLINNAKNDYNARVWLDRASAALSTCGCR